MKSTKSAIILHFAALFLLSCNNVAKVDPYECVIQTALRINQRQSVNVVYEVQSKGDARINAWFYYSPEGRVTIPNFTRDTSILVTLGPNDSILAGARGVVKEGSIKISFRAVAQDTVFTSSDICIQSLNANPTLP